VLIVEADAFARVALAKLLGAHGYHADTAANGREALFRLRLGQPPALILLTVGVPPKDSLEFCVRRASDRRLASVPVVVVSAVEQPLAARAGSLGIVGHLRKPVVLQELLALVARCCQ
jgi:CheY-like chemotaxis protein